MTAERKTIMTDEQKHLWRRLEGLMTQRAQMPEPERGAIKAEIETAADQLARLFALSTGAIERPVSNYTDEWIEMREEGEAEVVSWPPA